MIFGGTSDNCAVAELRSWGKISPEENRIYSKVIGEFLETTLHIPKNRFIILIDIILGVVIV